MRFQTNDGPVGLSWGREISAVPCQEGPRSELTGSDLESISNQQRSSGSSWGKGDLGGALPRSELTGSEASDDEQVVGFTD